jgi:hypothetical protein
VGGSGRTVASTERLTLAAKLQEELCVEFTYTWTWECGGCALQVEGMDTMATGESPTAAGRELTVTDYGGAMNLTFTVTAVGARLYGALDATSAVATVSVTVTAGLPQVEHRMGSVRLSL